ncbi:hypothetical protein CHU95_19195 [Niveispirillum lacus]|uniref:Uncharacterized protein n=1 Tax=Niveispirillum lacus TaxID=1981099 RepID=A0A255YUF1_9PROT|nr:hypothetical protein CHU95_19195 [Niveispirillum lacus]
MGPPGRDLFFDATDASTRFAAIILAKSTVCVRERSAWLLVHSVVSIGVWRRMGEHARIIATRRMPRIANDELTEINAVFMVLRQAG